MDKASGLTPLYMQLREIIRYKIETGEFAPCTALPSENELADEYAVTRQTVRNAIETLVNEGLLRRVAEKAGYGHMYLEAPGDHEWPYWDKAIQYAFQFFRNMDMKTTPIY